MDEAELIEKILSKKIQEEEAYLSEAEQAAEREKIRKKVVQEAFQEVSGKAMTEEQYKEYITLYDNFKPQREEGNRWTAFNILNYINSVNLNGKQELS